MKIALCFYGQPRSVPKSFNTIRDNLIIPNEIKDVFVHTWWRPELVNYRDNTDSGPRTDIKEEYLDFVKKNYNPKSILIEDDLKILFHSSDLITKYLKPAASLDRLFPSFYSRFKVFYLLKEYEETNNLKYDAVVISRLDTFIKKSINISELDLNQIHINSIEWNPTKDNRYTSDFLIISNRQLMEIYSEIYNEMPAIAERMATLKEIPYFAESIAGNHLNYYNIIHQPTFHTRDEVALARH